MKISTHNKRMKTRKIKEYIISSMKNKYHIHKKDIYILKTKDSYNRIMVGIYVHKNTGFYSIFSNTLLPANMQINYKIVNKNKHNEPILKYTLTDFSVRIVEKNNENSNTE